MGGDSGGDTLSSTTVNCGVEVDRLRNLLDTPRPDLPKVKRVF